MPAAMTIAVGEAGKVGDGVNAYYVFPVTSTAPAQEPLCVDRRYSDFLWLHHQLSRQCAGFIIPPLPAKVVGFLQGPEFLEQRRVGLERFLRKVAAHGELREAGVFRSFLECSAVELTALKADSSSALSRLGSLATPRGADSPASCGSFSSPSAGAALSRESSFTSTPTSFASVVQRTQALNSWWGKACQRLAENSQLRVLAARAGHELPRANTIEDPVFDAHVQYLADLGAQVGRLKAKVRAAHQQNKLAAGSYCDLIECLSAMAEGEDARGEMPASYFQAALALLDTRAKHLDGELDKFAARVDGLGRWVKAVQRAVAVREDRRLHYQAQLAAREGSPDADKLAAGPEDKGEEPHEPSDELLAAKDEFEQVHARVMKEIARFRTEKAGELRKMFLEFAALQLRCSAELADVLATSSKALDAPLPAPLRAADGATSFYDSSSSVGSSSGGDDENAGGALANQAVYPSKVPTKARVSALSGAVAKAKASLAGASEPSYSDVRL